MAALRYLFQHTLNYLHLRIKKLRAVLLVEPGVLQLLEDLSRSELFLVLLHAIVIGVLEYIGVHVNYLKSVSKSSPSSML